MYGVIDLLHEHTHTHTHTPELVFIYVCTKQRMGCRETEMNKYFELKKLVVLLPQLELLASLRCSVTWGRYM